MCVRPCNCRDLSYILCLGVCCRVVGFLRNLKDLRRLSNSLTRDALVTAANALVSSRLDYCNSLFRSLSSYNMRKLQTVQNSLAHVVTKTTKYTHISPVRKIKLHWLPIEYHCVFKTALLVYKFLHSGTPDYFIPYLKPRPVVPNQMVSF